MRDNEVRSWICIAAVILPIAFIGVGTANSIANASQVMTVIAQLQPRISIHAPNPLNIPYQEPPNIAKVVDSIGVNANIAWTLSIKANNNGHMTMTSEPFSSLANALNVRYVGEPMGPNLTLTDQYQLYHTGSLGVNNLTTEFSQLFSTLDKQGQYSVNINYLAQGVL